MFSFGTTTNKVRTFGRDRNGNFGLAFAGVSAALLLAIGYGVNVSQIYSAKSALLAALDTAVTSTAYDITTGKISKDEAPGLIRAFLETNAQNSMLRGHNVQLANLEIDDTKKTVSASATVDLAMFFPLFQSANNQHIETQSTAQYSDRQIEVAMMLDVTGSMEGTKLKDLKEAAKGGVDAIFEKQSLVGTRIRIALVPYSNAVNVGSLASTSVFFERTADDRTHTYANTDPKMASAIRTDNCATERKGTYQYTDAGPGDSMVNRDYLLSKFATQASTITCPAAAIMPLTADAKALKTRIDSFVAKGGTAGQIGVQWAWYMLSPKWASVLETSQRPGAYDTKKTGKFAILMTDGAFNLEYAGAKTVKDDQVYNEVYGNGSPKTRSIARTKELCSQMRKAGIEVFTIGFDLAKEGPDAKSLMADCASTGSTKYFYEAATGTELKAAFQAIAANIERLALTK